MIYTFVLTCIPRDPSLLVLLQSIAICQISWGNFVGAGCARGTKARKQSHLQRELHLISALNVMLN